MFTRKSGPNPGC